VSSVSSISPWPIPNAVWLGEGVSPPPTSLVVISDFLEGNELHFEVSPHSLVRCGLDLPLPDSDQALRKANVRSPGRSFFFNRPSIAFTVFNTACCVILAPFAFFFFILSCPYCSSTVDAGCFFPPVHRHFQTEESDCFFPFKSILFCFARPRLSPVLFYLSSLALGEIDVFPSPEIPADFFGW